MDKRTEDIQCRIQSFFGGTGFLSLLIPEGPLPIMGADRQKILDFTKVQNAGNGPSWMKFTSNWLSQ